jgi:hypothetical protein
MPYREIITVCSQIHTKHINTLCGQNVGLLNVKPGGAYSYACALMDNKSRLTNSVEVFGEFQQIPMQFMEAKFRQTLRVHNFTPLVYILSQINPLHTLNS